MPEPDAPLEEIYLMPGEARLVRKPCILRTLVGSCVGVTFWVPRLAAAAMCHGMLPTLPPTLLDAPGPQLSQAASLRYVDFAIRFLLRRLAALGARRNEVEVKLFGGADVLSAISATASGTVGELNCASALETLARAGIPVAASRLRGKTGVDIRFNTATGHVLLRRLRAVD